MWSVYNLNPFNRVFFKLNFPTNHNKTNIIILRIHNICGLKVHLSDFSKASMSQIDLIWFSRAFHRIIDLYEHAFLIISVLGLCNLQVTSSWNRIYFDTLQKDSSWDMANDDNKPDALELMILSHT